MPSIFDSSAECAKIEDWLAERGGFEPETLLEFDVRKPSRVWRAIRSEKKASVLKRIRSQEFGSCRDLSPVPFVTSLMLAIW
jgi:hypothetical protein